MFCLLNRDKLGRQGGNYNRKYKIINSISGVYWVNQPKPTQMEDDVFRVYIMAHLRLSIVITPDRASNTKIGYLL
jgi:hypothetical protein